MSAVVRPLTILTLLTWASILEPIASSEGADKFIHRKLESGAQKLLDAGQFSTNGQTITIAGDQGLLQTFDVASLQVIEERNLGVACTEFGQWRNGFVVVSGATQELIVLDRALEEQRRVSVPGIVRFATAPTLEFGFVIEKNRISSIGFERGRLRALNTAPLLAAAKQVKRPPDTGDRGAPLDFRFATCTRDGKTLVTMADYRINRFRIRRGGLVWEECGWRVGASGTPISLSLGGNPALVAIPCGSGNRENVPGHPVDPGYGTFVYEVSKLSVPKVTVKSGAYPNVLAFDPELKLIYAQNHDTELLVYNHAGAKLAEYKFGARNAQTRAYAVHPDGGRLLVLTGDELFWCELPDDVIDKAGT